MAKIMTKNLTDNKMYMEDVKNVASLNLSWNKFQDKTVLLSGGRGLLGSFLVDVLMYKNVFSNLNCKFVLLGRNKEQLEKRFDNYLNSDLIRFIEMDINEADEIKSDEHLDYVLHLASNTHPVSYATDPIGTIMTNVLGLDKMLNLASKNKGSRFIFASSNEIYGENRRDVELFDEKYCGYIDSNTLRAGYPESKRCGEALCQAYISQKNVDAVICRFTRSYGPTMLLSDTKAISQFLKKGIDGEDIVLKSKGNQYYSYTYMADAILGLLYILLDGKTGEAYNVSDIDSDIRLKDLAEIIASECGRKVVVELPDEIEEKGYSKATIARLDGSKLRQLGWEPFYNIKSGIKRTLDIMRAEN